MERSELPRVDDLVADEDPAYYGRYRLSFDMVAPWIDVHSAFAKVRPGATAAVERELDRLRAPNLVVWPIHVVNQGRASDFWCLEHGEPEDDFVAFYMLPDACYIDMRNFRLAVERLAPHLEDAHFFVLSTGDGDDRWIDEYRITDGRVLAERWLWPSELADCGLDFYDALAARRGDLQLARFARKARAEWERLDAEDE